jgi:SOS-response transcriptional repressor LexA
MYMFIIKLNSMQGVCMVSPEMRAPEPTMHHVGPLIRARRRELGLTLEALARTVGCAKSYLSTIENERKAPPSQALLLRLERGLQLADGALQTARQWQSMPREMQREMIDLRNERHIAQRLATLLAGTDLDAAHRSGELGRLVGRLSEEPVHGSSIGAPSGLPMQVPLINNVAAGYPRQFTDLDYPARVADAYVSVPEVSDADAFAARVVGDSMEPAYREGDIVVFSPRVDATGGSDCFVRLSEGPPHAGETTFKRVYFEAGVEGESECGQNIRLQPLNSAYPPRVVPREAVEGLYRAVYVIREVGG